MLILGYEIDANGLNVGVCICGFLLSAILLLASISSKAREDKGTRYIILFSFSAMMIYFFDCLTYLEMITGIFSHALRVYLSCGIVTSATSFFCLNMYMIYRLKKRSYISGNLIYFLAGVYGFLAIVFCVGMMEDIDWFYYLDSYGNFVSTTAFYVFNYFEFLTIFIDLALVISSRKDMRVEEFVTWMIVFSLPIIAYVFYRVSGIDLIDLSIVGMLIILYITIHAKDREEKNMAEKELVESNAKLLVSQIQPHFLYNSLNTIYYLIDDDPEKAKDAVNTFSDYLRGNVKSLNNNMPVPIEEELNHVRAYLSLEKLRFGDKIFINIDEQSSGFVIPPLTIQPLVENAIKHGLSTKKDGGHLLVKTYEDPRFYYVDVIDDGVGFEAKNFTDVNGESTHIGLFNVYSRLMNMCQGKLKVVSEPGKGTQCTISIPKKKKSSS